MTSPWPGQIGQDPGMLNPATTKEALADMESSLSRQLENLERVRSGVAEVTQSRMLVEEQMAALAEQSAKLTSQSERAVQLGRMDLAQAALTRWESAQETLSDLAANFKLLRDEEAKIARAAQVVEGQIYAFEVRVKMARVEVYGPELAA